MAKDYNIIVLISGRGSNLLSLITNANNYGVSAVISNDSKALGLEHARNHKIPYFSYDRGDFSTVQEQKEAIFRKVNELAPNLIVLAGFMLLVNPEIVAQHWGKIINIHPALLPNLPGLDTHQRAIESQCQEHGCTVHFVDQDVDTGPIIAQAACQVEKDDSCDSLAAHVLKLEHCLYPWAINMLADGAIWLDGQATCYDKRAINSASRFGFRLIQ